jgi:hypothetical protein
MDMEKFKTVRDQICRVNSEIREIPFIFGEITEARAGNAL